MKEETVIKYFDIVLLSEKKDSFFDVNSLLHPKYIKENNKELHELWREIKSFSQFHEYFEYFPNQNCKLTEKGLKAKGKGGHLKLLEYEENKEKKQDELLDLDVTLKRFESKIGRKIIIAGIIISVLSFLITISTIKISKNSDDNSKKVEQVNDLKSHKGQEKLLDTLK
jgi:hypothetical protein